MDLINELAFIISKLNSSEFDLLIPKHSKAGKLYDLVVNQQIDSHEKCCEIIYGYPQVDKAYLMLKKNLITKLCEIVLISDFTQKSRENYVDLKFHCNKQLEIAEKLLLQNVYHNATKITLKVYKKAKENWLTEQIVNSLNLLCTIYALKGFPDDTTNYYSELTEFLQHFTKEKMAKGMADMLQSKIKFQLSINKDLATEAYKFAEQIRQWQKNYPSPFLECYRLKLEIIKFKQINDSKNLIVRLLELENLYTKYPILKTASDGFELDLQIAVYYKNACNFELADKYLVKCLNFAEYKAFNRFVVKELEFDLAVRKDNYTEANRILDEVFTVPQFNMLDKLDLAAWEIRKIWLHIIKELFNNQTSDKVSGKTVSLRNFAEKTKSIRKDKQGYNLLAFIARIIILYLKDTTTTEDEGNSLAMYYHRYIKDMYLPKTRIFVKSLAECAKSNFKKEIVIIQANKYIEQTANEPLFTEPCEFIPFNILFRFLADRKK